jgi:hypothetical protein
LLPFYPNAEAVVYKGAAEFRDVIAGISAC